MSIPNVTFGQYTYMPRSYENQLAYQPQAVEFNGNMPQYVETPQQQEDGLTLGTVVTAGAVIGGVALGVKKGVFKNGIDWIKGLFKSNTAVAVNANAVENKAAAVSKNGVTVIPVDSTPTNSRAIDKAKRQAKKLAKKEMHQQRNAEAQAQAAARREAGEVKVKPRHKSPKRVAARAHLQPKPV